jgi:acyl dehydratase
VIADLVREITLPRMVAYAGATWDWHRLHYDQSYATERGLPAPVVDGQLLGALLAEQVQDHYGPDAFITEMQFRFAAMVFAGDTVTIHAEETGRDGDVVTVLQTLTVGERVCIKDAVTRARVR